MDKKRGEKKGKEEEKGKEQKKREEGKQLAQEAPRTAGGLSGVGAPPVPRALAPTYVVGRVWSRPTDRGVN